MIFRRTAASLIAGVAALSLMGAAAPTAPVGTASTSLLGAEVEVTNLGDVPVVRILDVATYASTDTDAARNATGNGVPFAQSAVIPLKVGDTALGATTASSDGDTSASSDGVSYGDALSALGVDVTPVQATASAGSTQALATVNTLVADLTALIGALGVEIDVTGLTSQVTTSGASAIQGIQVGDISLTLADLGLDEDLLGSLPLGDLLDLLEGLPVPLPDAVLAAVDAVNAALADVQAAVAALGDAGVPIAQAAAALDAAVDALATITELEGILTGLEALNPTDLDFLTEFSTFLGTLTADELAILDGCAGGDVATAIVGDPAGVYDTLITCLGDAIAAAAAPVLGVAAGDVDLGTVVADVTAVRDSLVADITALVDALPVDIAELETLIAALTDALNTLDALIADLLALLPDVAGTELLSVGAFDIGITALATDDIGTSSATVGCSGIDVTVLGETFSTPDCSEGLTAISDALAGVTDAVAGVVDLLNTLPLAGLVEVGDLQLDVLGGVTESVSSDGVYTTATAAVDILTLEIPSITIDPSVITDLVGLDLGDIVGTVEGALNDALTALEGVTGTIVDTAIATVQTTLTEVGDPAGLSGVVDTLDSTISALDLGSLGSLDQAVTTPGLRLVVDPSSTAEFAAGEPAPAPTPAPEPDEQPSLPATGGGLAIVGMVALAGAVALRRRR